MYLRLYILDGCGLFSCNKFLPNSIKQELELSIAVLFGLFGISKVSLNEWTRGIKTGQSWSSRLPSHFTFTHSPRIMELRMKKKNTLTHTLHNHHRTKDPLNNKKNYHNKKL